MLRGCEKSVAKICLQIDPEILRPGPNQPNIPACRLGLCRVGAALISAPFSADFGPGSEAVSDPALRARPAADSFSERCEESKHPAERPSATQSTGALRRPSRPPASCDSLCHVYESTGGYAGAALANRLALCGGGAGDRHLCPR